MSEDKKRTGQTDGDRRRLGRFWLTVFVVAPAVILGGLAWKAILLRFRSAGAQLAAIEAARAIPESEDAGTAYVRLASEYLPLPQYPRVADNNTLLRTVREPWLSRDHTELAAWIDERQDLMSKLLDISELEQCRLPIPSDIRQTSYFTNPIRQMRGWSYLLVRSANMDVAEGRIDAAIEKYRCVLRMGAHLRQQSTLDSYNGGAVMQYQHVRPVKQLVIEKELTDEQLTVIEAAVLAADESWKTHLKRMVRVQMLLGRRGRPRLKDWREYWDHRRRTNEADAKALERAHRSRLRVLAGRCEMCILIALRRFKNKTGHWPRSLDQIEPQLSRETLTDPRSNTPFIYELEGENFKLHSKEAD